MECILPTKKYGDLTFYIDDEDEILTAKYNLYVCNINNHLYIQTKGRKYLHRLIMKAQKGDVVDHINHNTLDNRKSNLRIVSYSQNSRNRYKAYTDTQKLSKKQVKEILLSNESNNKLASKYNVSNCLISNIRTGKEYKDYCLDIPRKIWKNGKYELVAHDNKEKLKMKIDKEGLKLENLTKRETDVYIAVVEGFNTKQICEMLNITMSTYKTHLNNIYSKRGLHNKHEIVVDFLRNQECFKFLQEIKKIAAAKIENKTA